MDGYISGESDELNSLHPGGTTFVPETREQLEVEDDAIEHLTLVTLQLLLAFVVQVVDDEVS